MIYDRVFNVSGMAYNKCGSLSCTVCMLEVFSYAVQKVIPLKRFIFYVTSKGKLCRDRYRFNL